jgi:hypothetical protein
MYIIYSGVSAGDWFQDPPALTNSEDAPVPHKKWDCICMELTRFLWYALNHLNITSNINTMQMLWKYLLYCITYGIMVWENSIQVHYRCKSFSNISNCGWLNPWMQNLQLQRAHCIYIYMQNASILIHKFKIGQVERVEVHSSCCGEGKIRRRIHGCNIG